MPNPRPVVLRDHEVRAPKRIQRKRTRGYKMPEGCVYVGRPTKWGNPFAVTKDPRGVWEVRDRDGNLCGQRTTEEDARRLSVALYRAHIDKGLRRIQMREDLRGKDLACWCPLDVPCHADILLELANK